MYTLAHLHVICRDMEKMIRFWSEALGAEFVEYRTFGDDPGAIMRFGGLEIYFKEIPQAKELQSGQVGYEHVGVYVPHLETSVESLVKGFGCTPVFPCRAASYPFQSLSCWRAEGHQEEMHCNFIHINSTLEYLTRAVGYIPDPASTETAPSSVPRQAPGQPQHGMVYKTLRSPSLPRHKKAEPLRLRFLYGVSQASRKRLSASRAAA